MITENILYVVATPIGNLADLSARAIQILETVDVIAAEDTRHSGKLLQHYHISTPLLSYHDHGGERQLERILERLSNGQNVALISDAGTPLIADPGFRLVRRARDKGIKVVPIPGACALVAALSVSGLPSDRFTFEGFPPAKGAPKQRFFETTAHVDHTLIFYESPHRIMDTLTVMSQVYGADRWLVLGREISKTYESFLEGDIETLIQRLQEDTQQQRGEMVLMLKGFEAPPVVADEVPEDIQKMIRVLLDELPTKQAVSLAAKISGLKKNPLYQWALTHKNENK